MKIAVLCLCLFTIAFAAPIKKSKIDDGSMSSEENHDSRDHHVHRHHHHHHHSNSQSQENSPEDVNSHELQEHPLSSRLSSESDESEENTQQQTLLVPSGKSKEDDRSDMDDLDDLDDHGDMDDNSHSKADDSEETHESDDSHQVITEAPNDDPLTPSAEPGPYTGRGDSPMFLRKSHQFDSHDTTQKDDSILDADSHESHSSKVASFESQDTSIQREDKSNLQDSNEDNSASHHKSVENDSYDSSMQLKVRRQESQEADHDHNLDNVSKQSVEYIDDHHSSEDNEIEY